MVNLCGDCSAILAGPFCQQCGQRRFEDDDRRLIPLLRDFFEDMSRLDGRWWRSLIALLFRPGVLSRAWLEGKRTRYAKPAALFLFANLLYFVAPSLSDFNLSLTEQMHQPYSAFSRAVVDQRVAARTQSHPGYRLEDYARAYDTRSEAVGKALIILHVPFLALALLLLFWSGKYYYAEHFAVGLQLFAFFLLSFQPVLFLLDWLLDWLGRILPSAPLASIYLAGFALVYAGYFAIALKRTYRCGWTYAVFSGAVILVILCGVQLFIYRPAQFALTFALT
jgi:hypothetical protein